MIGSPRDKDPRWNWKEEAGEKNPQTWTLRETTANDEEAREQKITFEEKKNTC